MIEFVHDHAHASTTGTNTGADGIDIAVVREHGNLGAVTWFAGTGLDFDNAVSNFGNFKFEETLDETGVRTADHNLRSFVATTYFNDVCLEASTWRGTLERNLLTLWHECFDFAKIKQGIAVIVLLNDARDNVAFAVGIFFELLVALGFADALTHHLTEGLCRNATKFVLVGSVVALVDPVAVFVDIECGEGDFEGVGVETHFNFFSRTGTTLVRGRQGFYENLQKGLF